MEQAPRSSFTIPVAAIAAIAAFGCLATMVFRFLVFNMPLFLLAFLLMPVPAALLIGVMAHAPIFRTLAILHMDLILALYAVVLVFAAEEGADSILWLSAGIIGPICLLHYLQLGETYAEFLPAVALAEVDEFTRVEQPPTPPSSTQIFRDPNDPNR